MMLIEQTTVPAAVLPVRQFKDHLRLGTGFADDAAQDTLLEALLRAAIATVEGRCGKVLLARDYTWTLMAWREAGRQPLPVAPVRAIGAVTVIDRAGQTQRVDPATYRLDPDSHRPRLVAVHGALPHIPLGGRAEMRFEAGFGAEWGEVPPDLAQAVMLLSAYYHEYRHGALLGDSGMPFGVMALIERWRTVRVLGGMP
ncbi:putative phiE125 gp8 family phage protein [Rhodovulum imhoffii]|uniref:Putative phiE125 gp8 family phage protein n=1 Tax=Rhodovulum imhoffii TaxID=365340 RepID=A0A2T5BVA9_9RHOB|nr:hypothetical protein [Rhodovulum imhoffii]MBK5934230.1 hypothetical protein [Rhodovulum imhoffii]PTN03523.1 putative phiE125 gp8 family phage protein [Rhodovulum imhoffii]